MRVLNFEDQKITDAEMRSIRAKTMVIVGDADGVKPEHAVAMFELRGGGDEEAAARGMISELPQARLVILPATSHISISAAQQVLAPMITAFLDDIPRPLHRCGDLRSALLGAIAASCCRRWLSVWRPFRKWRGLVVTLDRKEVPVGILEPRDLAAAGAR